MNKPMAMHDISFLSMILYELLTTNNLIAGKHLAEHCKEEYPSPVKYCLWILAEVAVIAADIPEGIICRQC